jgi:hypothetical protein
MVWPASGGSPATMKTPTGEVVLIEALGVVGLARVAMNRCGVERGQWQHNLVAPRGRRGVYL